MMSVAKVREVIRMQKPSKAIATSREIRTWPDQIIQRCSVSRPMGWQGATTLLPKTRNSPFCCGAPGELQAFVVLINVDVVAHNPKLAFFVGPQASSKRSWF